ncbi:AMP-binding enzyme domain-containing protein [Phthorimaea operculella]|nr:AMP-binding enzyme domain-containing protein [Phthorimaea operculella]
MHRKNRVNDSVFWYMEELSSRVVAESGRACDRFHLGKLVLRGLKDAPDHTLQIDAATGLSENSGSVLQRSVRCAIAMKNSGIQYGDVVGLYALNHVDVTPVYYACLYLGVTFAPGDKDAKADELPKVLDCDKPKIIFCQAHKVGDMQDALTKINQKAEIVTFDDSEEKRNGVCSFSEFMKKAGENISVDEFKATDFDPESTIASLLPTSGTTGAPKKAIITHKNFMITGPHLWSRSSSFPTPTRMVLLAAPIRWVSTTIHYNMSPILRYTRLQTSATPTVQHVQYMINTYKPSTLATSTTLVSKLMKSQDIEQCDLTCLEQILFGGSPAYKELLDDVRAAVPSAEVFEGYGFTEASTYFVFEVGTSPNGSCGKPTRHLQYRLVSPDTQQDITECNTPGELWVKGPGLSKGYYNNPEATRKALTEDGWYKTGDLLYCDDQDNFYFVDRINSLIRYGQYLISPAELEVTIRGYPGVSDVAVSEVPEEGAYLVNLPVACVVRKPGANVTAQEIKDLVKDKLEYWKHLRGGVIFMEELPITVTTKVDRIKLKDMVLKLPRE